jgi:hypothetical protein
MSAERPSAHRRQPRRRAWLLVIPIAAPLLSPLTNSIGPRVWGIPFFYWYQIFCAFLAIAVITSVFVMGRERR